MSPADSLTNFRSRVNLPEASTSPVEVLLLEGVDVEGEAEEDAAVVAKGRLGVEVTVAAVVQEGQLVRNRKWRVIHFTSQYGAIVRSQAQ